MSATLKQKDWPGSSFMAEKDAAPQRKKCSERILAFSHAGTLGFTAPGCDGIALVSMVTLLVPAAPVLTVSREVALQVRREFPPAARDRAWQAGGRFATRGTRAS